MVTWLFLRFCLRSVFEINSFLCHIKAEYNFTIFSLLYNDLFNRSLWDPNTKVVERSTRSS